MGTLCASTAARLSELFPGWSGTAMRNRVRLVQEIGYSAPFTMTERTLIGAVPVKNATLLLSVYPASSRNAPAFTAASCEAMLVRAEVSHDFNAESGFSTLRPFM